MKEVLECFAQVMKWFIFELIPEMVATPFGELGKHLIEKNVVRYGIGIIVFVVLTGAYKLIKK